MWRFKLEVALHWSCKINTSLNKVVPKQVRSFTLVTLFLSCYFQFSTIIPLNQWLFFQNCVTLLFFLLKMNHYHPLFLVYLIFFCFYLILILYIYSCSSFLIFLSFYWKFSILLFFSSSLYQQISIALLSYSLYLQFSIDLLISSFHFWCHS